MKGRPRLDSLMVEIFKEGLDKAKAKPMTKEEAAELVFRQLCFVSKIIEDDIMTLDQIAEMFNMPLSTVQAIAQRSDS